MTVSADDGPRGQVRREIAGPWSDDRAVLRSEDRPHEVRFAQSRVRGGFRRGRERQTVGSAPENPVIWIRKEKKMTSMKTTALALRLAGLLGTAAFFAASPVTVKLDGASALPQFVMSAALADSGGHGRGGDDHGGDDHGGRGHGGDDNGGDDGGRHHSSDDGSAQGGSAGGGSGITKLERSAGGIEVTYADGTREEVQGGVYERKNSAGRTVEERPATQADINRLSALF